MKRMILAVLAMAMLSACGSGSDTPAAPAPAPTVNSTGTWRGLYTSSIVGAKTATLSVVQSGSSITGNYASTAGGLGSVSGTVSDKTATFVITVTTSGCSGSFNGTGVINDSVSPPTMAFNYSGATNAACGGSENGTGNLVKQ